MKELTSPIILIGFMGTGKSTIGEFLSNSLNLSFVDLDVYIENKENKSIPNIFEENGEQRFRELEHQYLLECIENFDIIATGGGIIEHDPSYKILKQQVNNIWLDCKIDIIHKRIVNDPHRPNAKNKTKSQLKNLYLTRVSRYNEIAFIKVNSELAIQNIYDEIIKELYRD